MAKSKALTVVKKSNCDRIAEDAGYRASVQVALELENIRQDGDKAVREAIESAFNAGIEYAVSHGITFEQWREING